MDDARVAVKRLTVVVPIPIDDDVAENPTNGCDHASYDASGVNPNIDDDAAMLSSPVPPAV